jgi:hypothetical protein
MNANERRATPRTFGVYELPSSARSTRRFRFGNHPIRMQELEREFGVCRLVDTYGRRDEAVEQAAKLNAAPERTLWRGGA